MRGVYSSLSPPPPQANKYQMGCNATQLEWKITWTLFIEGRFPVVGTMRVRRTQNPPNMPEPAIAVGGFIVVGE